MPVALRDPALHLLILGYLGAGALLAALVLAGFSALLSFWAGWRESDLFVQVGRRAFYAATAMTVLAAIAAFAVPFAFASAALLAGRSDAAWIRHTRRFALVAWGLQSAGLLLGMWWAYHVLGWGGYWGWDPVENVALMPWLATTAYLHSSQVQERRGRLRGWNLGLVMLAFLLVVFGTFIVRSGVVPSVRSE